MFEKVLGFVKEHVKVTVTVVTLGVMLTFGWAKGCVVDVAPAPVEAPVALE